MSGGCLALTDATVFTAAGDDPFEGGVVVEGDRIADILTHRARPGAADRVVSLRGGTLLPGLIDAHVHAMAVDANIQDQDRNRFESEAAVLAAHSLADMLRRGFTTVRDAGGTDAGMRRLIESGAIPGPRLFVSGRPLSQTGGHGDRRRATEYHEAGVCAPHVGMVHAVADGPDEVRRSAREELRRGANQIKVMAGGGVMSPTDRLESVQYSLEELSVATSVAASTGAYVLAHAYTPEAIRVCVEAGVRSIEHGNLLDAQTASLMAARGVYLVPTLITYQKLHEEGTSLGIPSDNLDKLVRVLDAGLESIRLARDAGVAIGSGSDLLGPMRRHQGQEIGLQAQVLGPEGAIVAATRTNAELLGVADETGTIEVGKQADIVAVRGDALADATILGDAGRILMVMRAGRVYVDRVAEVLGEAPAGG